MPPKARKVKQAAAAKIKKQAQDEEAAEPEPLTASSIAAVSFKAWRTSSKLVAGGKLNQMEAQWNVPARRFTQTLEVHHNEPFTLKPLVITEGKLKGRHVLMLEPVENKVYFRFLDLPPELRTMVYDLLLDGSKVIKIDSHKPPHKERRPVTDGFVWRKSHGHLKWDSSVGKWEGQQPSDVSIMGVNKQLHHEAASAIYGRVFDLNTFRDAQIFLETIGSCRSYLKHVQISSDRTAFRTSITFMLKLLAEAKGLKCLEISHDILCEDTYRWDRHMSPALFVALCKSFMNDSHKARKADSNAVQALDLIKVTPAKICYKCKDNDQDSCVGLNCRAEFNGKTSVKCVDKETHDESVERKTRTSLAKLLGIKDV